MQFTRLKISFFLLSLSLFHTKRIMAIQTNKRHLLSDIHKDALRKDFNDCMSRIEKDKLKYHSCQGFSSAELCRCYFVKGVDYQCKSLSEKSINYSYFEHQVQYNCKGFHKIDYSLQVESKNMRNTINKYGNNLCIDAPKQDGTDILVEDIPPEYKSKLSGLYRPHNLDNNIKASHRLKKRSNAAIDTLDFKEYYEKKKPNAMTINCNLMRSLKITASLTSHQMTQFSTTILVQNPTGTHTTSLEAIMVLPKNKVEEQLKDPRQVKRSGMVSCNSSTNSKETSIVYLSKASFFTKELPLILLVASIYFLGFLFL